MFHDPSNNRNDTKGRKQSKNRRRRQKEMAEELADEEYECFRTR